MVKLSKLLMLLFIANSFHYSSQESKEIELQYVTKTSSYSNGESRSSSKMQWKFNDESKWQDLGKRYSIIEPVISTNKESADLLKKAIEYRKKYNIALVGSISGFFVTSAVMFVAVNKIAYNNPNSNLNDNFQLRSALILGPPLVLIMVGGIFIKKYKETSYNYFFDAVETYNKKSKNDSGMIQSLKFGLGFNNIPNTTKYTPQFSINIGLR